MEKIMDAKQFIECVCRLLEEEFYSWNGEMDVHAACVDTGEDGLRMMLLIFRSYSDIPVGFYLESEYKDYCMGKATVGSVADTIINSDRLYYAFYDIDLIYDADNSAEPERSERKGLRDMIGGYLKTKMRLLHTCMSK